jgi:two-component system alkaline phosphatase synthesis response regulator PhoP
METGRTMAQNRVLIVDDEPRITEVLRVYLERDGFQVASAASGKQAVERAADYKPDIIILDLNLPDIDGLEVCRTIRKTSNIPIIMLTGRGEEIDRIVGLEIGADDYVTKPFSAREVVARVRAVLRRQGQAADVPADETVSIGDLVIDSGRYQASCRGRQLDLTTTEFRLLATMAESPGRVYSRVKLLDAVQGIDYEGYDRTIDAHIKILRQKMTSNREACGCHIETVRGVGYKLEVDQDEV